MSDIQREWKHGLPLVGEPFRVGPELTDRYSKIISHGCHHVARDVGSTAFYFAQIESAVAQSRCESGLRKTPACSKLSHSAPENLTRGSGSAPDGRSDGLTHALMVKVGGPGKQQL
jgi:hypothetical protein